MTIAMHALNPLFLRDEEIERHLELLLLVEREILELGREACAKLGLSESSFRALYLIQRHPQTTMAELGTVLCIKKQSLSRHLQELCEAGYLVQEAGSVDRRKRYLQVTKEGADALSQVADIHKRALKRAFMAAGPDAVAGFDRVLNALISQQTRRFVGNRAA
ncbi:DNA-binding transcriptional regulator, MarR family [Arboricoccus pini]|uniref:DNA-binding transcriptional regulator, MarR family n=1 Tax=Arboricoccus pini TaxID=1963835 RepID=A0A212QSU4_9PROT|nr:MarR family transcriptional regulator [Arboricoccus pini]SNB62666.1 DNA-binding transcriptional regulator, MarR family [Arboricoccus pini]